MGDIIKHIIETGGDTVLKSAISATLNAVAAGFKKVLSRKDKKVIEIATERMIQAANMEDIERYDPKIEVIRHKTIIASNPVRYGGAPKKAAPKRANPAKKAAKKAAPKKAVVHKKAAPKKAVRTVQ